MVDVLTYMRGTTKKQDPPCCEDQAIHMCDGMMVCLTCGAMNRISNPAITDWGFRTFRREYRRVHRFAHLLRQLQGRGCELPECIIKKAIAYRSTINTPQDILNVFQDKWRWQISSIWEATGRRCPQLKSGESYRARMLFMMYDSHYLRAGKRVSFTYIMPRILRDIQRHDLVPFLKPVSPLLEKKYAL